jgi:hypothetical protein
MLMQQCQARQLAGMQVHMLMVQAAALLLQ